jgi:hypothetical protein
MEARFWHKRPGGENAASGVVTVRTFDDCDGGKI